MDIGVYDPIKKDGLNQYVVYSIKGIDNNGQYQVYRRYSDFNRLRNHMLTRWPGVYIPPIPSKQTVGNLKTHFIQVRMKQLDLFVKQVSQSNNLYYSHEFQLFIRSQSYDKDIQNIGKVQLQNIIDRMSSSYPDINQKQISTELEMKISQFNMFINKTKPILEHFLIQTKNIKNAKHQFQSQFDIFNRITMQEYEKNCISEYNRDEQVNDHYDNLMPITQFNTEQLGIINHSCHKLSQTDNSGFNDLEEFIRNELSSIEAIQDSLKQKTDYEQMKKKNENKQKEMELDLQKLISGKKTFKTIFTKTSSQDIIYQTEQQIAKLKKDQQNIQCICDIITVILGHIEIDRFKESGSKQYFEMLSTMGLKEKNYQKMLVDYWSQISQNPKLKLDK